MGSGSDLRSGRVDAIQALRALAVALVIGRHVLRFIADTRIGTGTPADVLLVGDAGVDIFFVVSGFVMGWTSLVNFGDRRRPGPFLLDRVTRIYPMYWLVTLPFWAVLVLSPDTLNRVAEGADLSVWRSFLLLPHDQEPLVGQAWTLIHEMYFYVVFAVLLILPRRAVPWGLALWATLPIAAHVGDGIGPLSPVLEIVLNPLTLEFIAGVVVALVAHRLAGTRVAGATGVLGILGLLALALLHGTTWETQPVGFTRVATYGVIGLFLVIGALWWEVRRTTPATVVEVGNASYTTYLVHVAVIGAITEVVPMPEAVGTQIAIGVVCAVACFVVGEVGHRVVERPLVRWARRATGRSERTVAVANP